MGNSSSNIEFNSRTTADQVVQDAVAKRGSDLQGLTVIVTGGNSGIGRETVRVLAKHKARVIVAGRSVQHCTEVAQEIAEETKNDLVSAMQLDLASLKSIRKFADEFNALNLPLDVLINNAGLMAIQKYTETEDGFEMQFGVNHIGHFYLTQLLTERLKEAKASRVVMVSGGIHELCKEFDWEKDMPPSKEMYGPLKNYCISKSANILYSTELNRRFQEKDETKHITCYSLHPGVIHTKLGRDIPCNFLQGLAYPLLKSPEQGAATTVLCAVHPDALAHPGGYFDNCQIAEIKAAAASVENSQRLWQLTEKLIQEKLGGETKADN